MRALLVLAAFLTLAAVAHAQGEGSEQAELDAARERWQARGLVNYRFKVQRECFYCSPAENRVYTVHVRDGEAVGAPEVASGYDTVPDLHAVAQNAMGSASFHATYDEIGVPTVISIDRSSQVMHDEVGYKAWDVREEDERRPKDVDDSIETGAAEAELAAARARWKEEGFESYRFRQRLVCFCPESYTRPRRLTVRDGKPVRPPRNLRAFASATRLFRAIERAIEDRVAGLEVRYGKTGMPRAVAIDRDDRIADEELAIESWRLRELG